jgi:hypothetical protein
MAEDKHMKVKDNHDSNHEHNRGPNYSHSKKYAQSQKQDRDGQAIPTGDASILLGSPDLKVLTAEPSTSLIQQGRLSEGSECRLQGLRRSDVELNGAHAVVVAPTKCGGGYKVRLIHPDSLGRTTVNVRRKNLLDTNKEPIHTGDSSYSGYSSGNQEHKALVSPLSNV